jgi:hypothetical protein
MVVGLALSSFGGRIYMHKYMWTDLYVIVSYDCFQWTIKFSVDEGFSGYVWSRYNGVLQ